MKSTPAMITRRMFINGLGLSTAGLYFGLYAYGATKPTSEPSGKAGVKPDPERPEIEKAASGLNPNVFLHLASTGVLSIVCHRSEMGQGIRSSLPVLIADELGADMAQVKIVQGDGNKAYGDQNTDGSNSVRSIYDEMRKVAATAREMLVAAAAKRLNVEATTLTTENHFVVHKPSSRKIAFGELAIEAGKLEIPKPDAVRLRPQSELKKVGVQMPLLDGPAYVAGTAQFGADVSVPGMLVAVIARPPVVGGKIKKFNKAAAMKVRGVKHVVELPHPKAPYGFQPWGGVAVLAEHTWGAMKGREALQATWTAGPNGSYNSASFRKTLSASANAKGTQLRNVGDVDEAIKSAAQVIEAEYYVPHLPHVSMEPPVALAKFSRAKGGSCEVWAATQNPQAAQTEVARVLGIPESRVTVHVTFLGGGFGRKSKADFCSEAALLSKKVGKPVRVQFTRPDDIHNDYLNTVNVSKLTASLDAKGKVTGWRHRTAFPPIASTFAPNMVLPQAGDLQQGVLDLAISVPNVRAESGKAEAHVRVG
ncbi:MAG: xanthine dehydrogenase family protein molybdopterin-binding subunit, partial [Proteobacteria bacterium]